MSVRELRITGDAPCTVNQERDRGAIPRQLKEVIDLVSSMNRRIEDCAVEWQAKISQAQWRILDSKPMDNKSWEESVLARTYFADKTLDNAFQGLLNHNKTFTDHVQNFVALVRGEQPTLRTRQTCNAQNQCSEYSLGDEERFLGCSSLLSSLDLSVLGKTPNTQNERIDCDSILTKAQDSFTNLMKAKINFDTKFLGFEATLSENNLHNICSSSDPSLGLCQICSRVLGCGMGKECKSPNNRKHVQLYRKKARRSSRIKHKRLVARRAMIKNKEKKMIERTLKESTQNNSYSNNLSAITIDGI